MSTTYESGRFAVTESSSELTLHSNNADDGPEDIVGPMTPEEAIDLAMTLLQAAIYNLPEDAAKADIVRRAKELYPEYVTDAPEPQEAKPAEPTPVEPIVFPSELSKVDVSGCSWVPLVFNGSRQDFFIQAPGGYFFNAGDTLLDAEGTTRVIQQTGDYRARLAIQGIVLEYCPRHR